MSKGKFVAMAATLALGLSTAGCIETTSYVEGGGRLGTAAAKALIGAGWLKCPSKSQNAQFWLDSRSLYYYDAYTGRYVNWQEIHGSSNCFYKG